MQVRQEGERQVKRRLKTYSLPLILAVGYRVRSSRGTQIRQWATAHLEEYLVKGFVMLAVIFLEQAELRALERKDLTLDYWRNNVDRLLEFNERPVLDDASVISARQAKQIAHQRYEQFDAQRGRAKQEWLMPRICGSWRNWRKASSWYQLSGPICGP